MRIFIPITILFVLMVACSNPTESNKGAGTILNIYMPDSLKLPETVAYALVRAQVEDPDGLKDVKSVYFTSLKPDMTYGNNGNPILMYDNATSGDEIGGDGIYSMGIQINSQNLVGRYLFTFEMEDKAGNLSAAVTDSIEVYE